MAAPIALVFDEMPQLARSYPRVLLQRKPTLVAAGRNVPRIEAKLAGYRVEPDQVATYRDVCGFRDARHLPLPLPHVLATPLHLEMLTHPRFPIAAFGLVHLRNAITQHRRIRLDEPLELRCMLEGHRETPRGQEFELWTFARAGGALVWEECCTFLARAERSARSTRDAVPRSRAAPPLAGVATTFAAIGSIGRDYARVSGDYNPIHLSALTARPFGFKAAIAHGMWTLARVAAELAPVWPEGACRMTIEFKQPVLLPAQVRLVHRAEGGALLVELRDGANDRRLHLSGRIEALGSLQP
jgi:hypothetical protein